MASNLVGISAHLSMPTMATNVHNAYAYMHVTLPMINSQRTPSLLSILLKIVPPYLFKDATSGICFVQQYVGTTYFYGFVITK